MIMQHRNFSNMLVWIRTSFNDVVFITFEIKIIFGTRNQILFYCQSSKIFTYLEQNYDNNPTV